MLELLLPRTDFAVAIQLAVVGSLGAVAIWRTWAHTDRRIFSIGATVLLIALMAVRALH